MTPCRVLIADPPWQPDDKLPGPKRGAAAHYRTLSVDDICRFPLPPLAPDAILFLWRLASMQDEALRVVKAWGFDLKTELIWAKLTKTGKRHFGMGHYVRAEHETCLIARRGRYRVATKSVRSIFYAKVPTDIHTGRARHSAKPDEFYALVRKLTGGDGPAVELFARTHRPGFLCFGDELEQPHPVIVEP